MIEQTQPENKTGDTDKSKPVDWRDTLPKYISLWGCLVAGVLGIGNAMQSVGIGAAACLLAAVAGFAAAHHIYSRKA
jgi:hypothetical protein